MNGTVSERLATWVVGLDCDDLPAEVIETAKRLVVDQLGVQLGGSVLPNVQPVRRPAAASGGRAEATLVGGSELVSAPQAVELRDGRRLETYQAGFHGHPVWPATDEDIAAKFRANLDGVTSTKAAESILALMGDLENAPGIRELTALLRLPEA